MRVLNIFCSSVACVALSFASATAGQTTDNTKIEVKDGKDVTVAGCVVRNAAGGFVLTTSEMGRLKYVLVTDDNLEKYVGRQVEIKGKAADRGKAHVKIDEKVKSDDERLDDKEARSQTEIKGDLPGMHYLAVKSVKPLSERL